MQNNEQLDVLYKLKKEIEKSNNEALVHTINQVIKKVYLNQYYHLLDIFQLVNQH